MVGEGSRYNINSDIWQCGNPYEDFSNIPKSEIHNVLSNRAIEALDKATKISGIDISDNLYLKFFLARETHFLGIRREYINQTPAIFGEVCVGENPIKMYIQLSATTSLSNQLSQVDVVVGHEIAHSYLDDEAKKKYCDNPDSMSQPLEYFHNSEYLADAMMSLVAGPEASVDYLSKALFSESDKEHPLPEQRMYAIKAGTYKEQLLTNLSKARDSIAQGGNFDSWEDFQKNESEYLAIQKSIAERCK